MVQFGSLILPTVLDINMAKEHIQVERQMPGRKVAYRIDQSDMGHTVIIKGEIRSTDIADVYTRIEQIRRMNDGIARTLNLQDGNTAAMTAKLVNPEYTFRVGDWFADRFYIPYTVTFLESV